MLKTIAQFVFVCSKVLIHINVVNFRTYNLVLLLFKPKKLNFLIFNCKEVRKFVKLLNRVVRKSNEVLKNLTQKLSVSNYNNVKYYYVFGIFKNRFFNMII